MLRVLGRGGLGTVYLCEDLRLPGKVWAIKELVCPESLPEGALQSFEREVQLLATLRHPSLPAIADCFGENGNEYLVMEFIEGQTLAAWVEQHGPVDEGQAVRWGAALAQVLGYLHTHEPQIVFRDLKPDNIMILPDKSLRLVDFGLARLLGSNQDLEAYGSVGYSPPEQWEKGAQLDARSDLYALGATLFFMLTGRHPSPVYGSNQVSAHRPGISRDLESWIAHLMAPDPARRPANASEVASHTVDLLLARRPGQGPLRRRRRFPFLPLMLGLLGLVVLGLAGALSFLQERKRHPPTAVDPRLAQARAEAAAGHAEQALALLEPLVRSRPEEGEAALLRENLLAERNGASAIHVPVIDSLTGLDGNDGYTLLYGLVMAQREINAKGGVEGHPLAFDLYDDGSESSKALTASQSIVSNPDYLLALGPFTSQRALQLAPVFNSAHLCLVAPTASDPRIWQSGPYLFTLADSNQKRIEVLARYLARSGLRRAAVLVDQSLIVSTSYSQAFMAAFEQDRGQIVAMVDYSGGQNDFSAQVRRILETRAQFVFQADYRSREVISLARELRESGSDIPISTQIAVDSPGFIEHGGRAVEGLLTSVYYHSDLELPEVQAFIKEWHREFPGIPSSHVSATAYDAVKVTCQALAEAIRHGGTTLEQRQTIHDFLDSIGGERPAWRGATGPFALGRKLELRNAYVVQIVNGAFKLVKD